MSYTNERSLDGNQFEKIIINGVSNLKSHIEIVNDLNVFPIPDGDTGENMYLTINGGVSSLKNENHNSIGKKAKALAEGMLLNARGNSGVILSQLFFGMANYLKDIDVVDVKSFGEALKSGVKQAYSSVVKPVEGTMLTVAREASDFAYENSSSSSTFGSFFTDYLKEMQNSLERTPELLAVLKEAGVIDSGGAGLVYIVEGMKKAIEGEDVELSLGENNSSNAKSIDFSKFNEDSVMVFGYCTEFLLQLQRCKCDIDSFSLEGLINFLEGIGDSIVAFRTGSIIKVHVHTLTPYKALEYCQQFGEFLTIKIENMTLQHNETVKKEEVKIPKVQRARRKFGLVTVATGEGLINTFKEMGADVVIDGGQGKNPSIEKFIEAFDEVNADDIFVLPNNSNIILAAKQAKEIYKKSNIWVIETKNFGDCYASLSLLDYSSEDPETIANNLSSDMEGTVTGMITKSIRDANINNVEIKEGEYIGFTGKTMYVSNPSKIDALEELLVKLDAKEKSFLICVYGKDLNEEEKQIISSKIPNLYKNLEFYEIDGNQEVYDLIVILE